MQLNLSRFGAVRAPKRDEKPRLHRDLPPEKPEQMAELTTPGVRRRQWRPGCHEMTGQEAEGRWT
jgi:hypothetical protein